MVPATGSVVCAAVFQLTCDPPDGSDAGRKCVPAIVIVIGPLPTTAQLGVMELTAGVGFNLGLIINAITLESPFIPAPDWGLNVCTEAVPGFAIKDAGTAAVTVSTLPALSVVSVVTRLLPFHRTTVFF